MQRHRATVSDADPSAAIAEHIARALSLPAPAVVAAKARCHLLDTLAAMVSGARLEAGRCAAGLVTGLGGHPEATVAGTELMASAPHAALANGMAAHADETDDSHAEGRFHPGCGVVPAALAMAEREGRSGSALLRAVVLGYDIGARFTMALGISEPKAARHSTHSHGALFGAAAAAGALAGLTPAQCRHMLSYAVQQASGLPYWHRDRDHIEKAFDFGGLGARNGVYAALMAQAGWTGVGDCVAGDHGYLSAFATAPRPTALTDGLGTDHHLMGAAIKKWCVGSPIQAALDSLTALMAAHDLTAEMVETLTAHMPDDRLHIVDDRDLPDICLQHLLAVTLLDGTLTFASAHDRSRMQDPAVQAVRARIRVHGSAELTQARPPRQAIIEIVTRDGRRLVHRTRAVRGTPDNPMTQDEVEAKALDLTAPVLGADKAHALIAAVRTVESLRDARELRPLLQA